MIPPPGLTVAIMADSIGKKMSKEEKIIGVRPEWR